MLLKSTLNRILGRQSITALFEEGLSATAGLKRLKSMGCGYRRKTFLADWRELTGAKKLERAYRFIPKKYAVSYNMMAPTETKQRRKFKYVFDTMGKDAVTGDDRILTTVMESDRRLSPDEAESIMDERILDKEDEYEEDYTYVHSEAKLKAVYRKVKK